jgi:16S rRNA (guanine966-N2)-methyltransferase
MTLRIISGKFKGRFLKTPKVDTTRPTQGALREAVFNICQMNIEGALVLDLFAGSGAIGFEA